MDKENDETFPQLEKINLQIGSDQKLKKIKGIYCSSNPDVITIIIDSTIGTDHMIQWDMKYNTSKNFFDIGKQYQIYFDADGDSVVATKENCLLNFNIMKAFHVDKNMYLEVTHTLG
jgi:hypothetical protein